MDALIVFETLALVNCSALSYVSVFVVAVLLSKSCHGIGVAFDLID